MRFTSQAILCAKSNTHIQYKQETVHQLHAQTQTLPFFANFNVISIFFEENFIILIPSLWGTYWQNISRQHQPVQRYQPLPIQHYWKQNKFRYYCFAYQVYKFTWIDNTNPNTYPFKLCKYGYFSTFVLYYWFIIYVKWLLPYLVCGSRSLGFKMNP